jgi:hypothetical protein
MNYDYYMNRYNWSNIDPLTFQKLSVDVSRIAHNIPQSVVIEEFKPGKDDGIDGRYYLDGQLCIIQSKHYKDFTSLKQNLIKEFESLKNRNYFNQIKRYTLATSVPLSPQDKEKIIKIFEGVIARSDDILGRNEIESIISSNKQIELKYYQLWLLSSAILSEYIKSITHNNIRTETGSLLQRIDNMLPYYVETANFSEVVEKIRKNGSLIITGEAGIGKTSLAQYLIFKYYKEYGYDPVAVTSIKEAKDFWDQQKKQIFYFDDFLGCQTLDALQNKDSEVIRFIEDVKRNHGTKLFILTSRTKILNQTKQRSQDFEDRQHSISEYQINIGSISNLDKANILYKHIWHSKIDKDWLLEIIKDKRYNKIIEEKNFIPRLIEFALYNENITDSVTKDSYFSYVLYTIRNPQRLWECVFKDKQTDYSNKIAYFVHLSSNFSYSPSYDDIYCAFRSFYKERINPVDMKNEFDKALKIAERHTLKISNIDVKFEGINGISKMITDWIDVSFGRNVNTEKEEIQTKIQLFNPSVGDYINKKLSEDTDAMVEYYKHLNIPSSISYLNNTDVINALKYKFKENNISTEYKDKLLEIIIKTIDYTDEDEVKKLSMELTEEYNLSHDNIKNKVREVRVERIIDCTQSDLSSNLTDIVPYCIKSCYDYYNGEEHEEADLEKAREKIYDWICDYVSDCGLDLTDNEIEEISDYIRDDEIEKILFPDNEDCERDSLEISNDGISDIDTMFEKLKNNLEEQYEYDK